jgi:tripartite-type tricarboxylate transporter receptor subunit TctC
MASRRATLQAIGASALALCSPLVRAQDKSPIRLMVGLPAGTSTDFTARLVAEKMRQQMGRTITVDNRAGAGQRLAMGELRHAAPNGQTLLLATSGPFSIYPHIYSKLDYDPVNDFTPIAGVATFDVCISTGPMTGAKNLKELVAWAKANPSRASYGSPGNGTLSHFVGIALGIGMGQTLTHVPYKDSNVAVVDVAAGRLPMHITGMSTTIELHRAGRIRIVTVSGDKRSALLPELPTLKESGYNVSGSATIGIFGPPQMPPELVAEISSAFLKAFQGPDIAPALGMHGILPEPTGTAELVTALSDEYKRVGLLARASGYVPE